MSRLRVGELLGCQVLGPSGNAVGRLTDIVVRLVDTGTPTVMGGLVRIGEEDVFMPSTAVTGMDASGLHLRAEKVNTRPFERRPGEVLLGRDVRGGAVVDVERGRLVRVADLVLAEEGATWHVTGVLAAPPSAIPLWLMRVLRRSPKHEEVPWQHVAPLVGHVPTAGRRLTMLQLSGLKPAEIADIVEAASHEEGEQILDAVASDEEFEADVFEELDETHRLEFLKERSDAEAAEILSNMEPDHAADLMMQLPQDRRLPILKLVDAEQQARIQALLRYGQDTAGGLMNNEFVALDPDQTVGEALRKLRALDEVPAVLTDVFAVDGERLVGSITLSQLVRAESEARLTDLIGPDPEAVYADADLPSVAVIMADYNLSSLPVIDEEGRLIGIVTYDDLVHAMLPAEWRWRGAPEVAHLAAVDEPEPGNATTRPAAGPANRTDPAADRG